MPNHCMNKLNIYALNAKRLEEVLSGVAGKEDQENEAELLSFDSITPTPPEMLNGKKEYVKFPDWYEFRLTNWGTKWNPYDIILDKKDTLAIFSFDTAWSPPIPIIAKLIEKYPDVTFVLYYLEPGNSFAGYYDGTADEVYEGPSREYYDMALSQFGWEREEMEA